jgi:hypothetical protein
MPPADEFVLGKVVQRRRAKSICMDVLNGFVEERQGRIEPVEEAEAGARRLLR